MERIIKLRSLFWVVAVALGLLIIINCNCGSSVGVGGGGGGGGGDVTTIEAIIPVDTGQDKCYDNSKEITSPEAGEDFYGQDAQYRGTQPSYKDNGNGTITDLNTSLTWQQSDDATARTWQEAINYAQALELAGYTDWRLPSRRELMSIANYGCYHPAIDTTYFPSCISGGPEPEVGNYWTSSESYVPDTPWRVYFYNGVVDLGENNPAYYVRCVRGGTHSMPSFQDNDNGTVTDLITGLIWQKTDDGQVRTWKEALSYAENLELAGHSDWRLPNIRELESIVDIGQSSLVLNPVFQGRATGYWSSTTNVASPERAWFVCFCCGYVGHYLKSFSNANPLAGYPYYVRCVRGQTK